ncbi:MAG: hypothetical protein LUG93_06320 [Lachnospiraceae bacterium]|nr:hypothetical protein [Lachnospiraceae bacterium]
MSVKSKVLNWIKALILPVGVWAVFSVITGGRFAKTTAILSAFRTAVVPIILGMTLAFGMVMNMWNFAAGAILYACAIFGAYFAQITNTGIPGLCVFSILTGVVLCAVMGILYRLLRVPCLVLSLGMVMVIEALPNIYVPGANGKIGLLDGYLGSSPYCYIILAIMFAIFYFINSCTTLGADMRAIGANIKIAESAGINIDRTKFISFLLSGVFLGVAGIVYMSANVSVTAVTGIASVSIIFDGIMGVFLAMVLMRWINFSASVLIGTFTIRLLSSGLVACGFSSEIRGILTGVFLFAVITFSANASVPEQIREKKRIAGEADMEFSSAKQS